MKRVVKFIDRRRRHLRYLAYALRGKATMRSGRVHSFFRVARPKECSGAPTNYNIVRQRCRGQKSVAALAAQLGGCLAGGCLAASRATRWLLGSRAERCSGKEWSGPARQGTYVTRLVIGGCLAPRNSKAVKVRWSDRAGGAAEGRGICRIGFKSLTAGSDPVFGEQVQLSVMKVELGQEQEQVQAGLKVK
ncbi:hypothetical protein BHE74_00010509 [Ensete ventricosum]|nr:hypothetical protein BHE74_00010509 [Ensete ventricosum]